MRKWVLLLTIAAQVGILAYMVYGRESIVLSGERIEITTAPLDPRDPFRGDFVRLVYPMNVMPYSLGNIDGEARRFNRNSVFYTSLKKEPGGTYAADQFSDKKPRDGKFIKGHLNHTEDWDPQFAGTVSIRYGLEQMFVEQGSGIDIEKRQGVRGGMQVPMHVEVAIGKNGTGIITGYRWNDVGAQLEIGDMALTQEAGGEVSDAESQDANTSVEPSQPALWLTFQNVSAGAVTLDLSNELCSLNLDTTLDGAGDVEPVFEGCADKVGTDFITLQSDEEHKLAIDLADPRWHVRRISDGEANDLRLIAPRQRFRIVYRYPYDTNDGGDQNLWRGVVRTTAFTGLGRID